MTASLSTHQLTFATDDGTPILENLTMTLGARRYGLVGPNGSGKSTFLKLLVGELTATKGTVQARSGIGYLPQLVDSGAELRVVDLMAVGRTYDALTAIEAGSLDERHYEVIGGDWDVVARSNAALARAGLAHLSLNQPCSTISGGEATLVRLLGLTMARFVDIVLLDEPTNHLDSSARHVVHQLIGEFVGCMIVVSHDRVLLDHMDSIGEIRNRDIRWYGGNFSDFENQVEAEQRAALRNVSTAQGVVKQQKHEVDALQHQFAKKIREGKKATANKRAAKIVAGGLKRKAQVSAGQLRNIQEDRLETARVELDAAREHLRSDDRIRLDLPDSGVATRKRVLVAERLVTLASPTAIDLSLFGPTRLAIVGPNGSGKTTLLRTLVGEIEAVTGSASIDVPYQYLGQGLDVLESRLSAFDNVRRYAPGSEPNAIRAQLARFLLRADAATRPVHTLSGGERWRATISCLLLARPTPQLLILDEPTNHLDLDSRRQLADALAHYRGAMILVSHEQDFLDSVRIDRTVELGSIERRDDRR